MLTTSGNLVSNMGDAQNFQFPNITEVSDKITAVSDKISECYLQLTQVKYCNDPKF